MEENREDTIYLNSYINEIYATTELNQYFSNPLNKAIELSISFPIKEEISLTKFVVMIDEKIVISKVMSKEKAKEKYSDAIASGNQGFISTYNEDEKSYSINLGNINPNQKIKLNSIFIQMIGSQDMSYEFNIMEKYPTFHYKELNQNGPRNKIINANFKIEAQSKLTRLIAPFLGKDIKTNSNYKVEFNNDFKKADIKYIRKQNDQIKGYQNSFSRLTNDAFYSSFSLLFRTENMNKPILYFQYNPELKEYAYSINYVYLSKSLKNIPIPNQPDQDNTISYYSKYEDKMINETPGLFIFLIDQSFSMTGRPIELVKQALLLFIQSLPSGSYFQLIGFGSEFKKYNQKPVEYNKDNVKYIVRCINNLDAEMGGTNISSPLKEIYKDNSYSHFNLSKNIFLLTDGDVDNREECIQLISTNSNKFRVHSLGIGDDFDKVLIELSGKLGKGSSSYIKDISKINSAVIDALNKCIRPYLIDIQFNFQNYKKNNSNSIIKCIPINNFTYQDEIMNYSFLIDEKNKIDIDNLSEPINVEIIAKDPQNPIKESVSFVNNNNIIKLQDGEEMTKMIIGKALKNNKELTQNKEKEVEFAKKYQILSKNTAFFAEILNDGNNGQTKLIKVDLNNYEDRRLEGFYGGYNICCAKKSINSYSYLSSMTKGAAPRMTTSCAPSSIEFKTSKINNNFNKMNISRENKNGKNDNMTKLIMSQDIIEGSWNENEETKKLLNIISQDKFNKICNGIKGLNKGNQEIKIIYTILVIYYLIVNQSQKLNDYRLILNKAKKFLIKQGIKYEDFISNIKI